VADLDGHPRHDAVSISASVDRGIPTPPSLAACLACFGLRADLLALRSFLPTASTPRRRRDHRLTTADASRLRRRGWRRLVAAIGTTGDGLSRPLAASFTALGLAGILLGTVPGSPALGTFGSAATAPIAGHSHALEAPRDSVAAHDGGPGRLPIAGRGSAEVAGPADTTVVVPADTGPLTTLSVAMLAVGAALFGMRRLAARPGRMR
jgi:hypothetical protein